MRRLFNERTYLILWEMLLLTTTLMTVVSGEGFTTILICWLSYFLTTRF